MKFDEIFVQL